MENTQRLVEAFRKAHPNCTEQNLMVTDMSWWIDGADVECQTVTTAHHRPLAALTPAGTWEPLGVNF